MDDDGDEDFIDPRIMDLINIQTNPSESETNFSLDDGSFFPPTYLVLRITCRAHPSAIAFLAHKITSSKRNGGAELLLRCEPFTENQDVSLRVTRF
jgi:hypothetical protein